MRESRGAESAHKDRPPQCGKTGKEVGALAQSTKCATAPIGHLRQVKTLITSTCLKHSDFIKIDNWIEMCLTAVAKMSRTEQLRHVKSTRPFRLTVAALFEFLTPAQLIQTTQTPSVRVVTHVSLAYVHPSQPTQLTNPISR